MRDVALFEALGDISAVDFVRDTLLESYSCFFPLNEGEVQKKVKDAFILLLQAGKQKDHLLLEKATKTIHKHIFFNEDKNYWFSLLYRNYKITTRSRVDFKTIIPYIKGKVLDFGSNGGYYALELANNGYPVETTDVLDCRDQSAKHIPFIQMKKPNVVPFKKDSFDTAIVKTVFHHIDNRYLVDVLKSLHSISKRIIIKEDIFGVSEEDFVQSDILEKDLFLKRYIQLGEKSQFNALVLVDFFGNVIAHGIDNMDLPFNFKKMDEWRTLLNSVGYKIIKIQWYGFEKTKLHQSLQAWIICDRK